MTNRRAVFMAGGVSGLLVGWVLAVVSALVVRGGAIPVLLEGVVAWAVTTLFLVVSLAEIPFMVFAMRSMVKKSEKSFPFVLFVAFAYTLFASVYSLVPIWLNAQVVVGLFMALLSGVRLGTLLFVPVAPVDNREKETA